MACVEPVWSGRPRPLPLLLVLRLLLDVAFDLGVGVGFPRQIGPRPPSYSTNMQSPYE